VYLVGFIIEIMKKGIIIDPQITQLCKDQDFSTKLNSSERRARKTFENVCRNFLGNKKVENYSKIVQELISSYSAVGHNMSLKLHFLHSHFNLFPENVVAICDKHGRRFRQGISQTEKWYSGKWSPKLADYCWSLVWETPTGNKEEA